MFKYKLKLLYIIIALCLNLDRVYSQTSHLNPKLWNIESFSGSILLEDYYRVQKTILKSQVTQNLKTSLFSGQLKLNSRSSVLHPNFILIDLDLDYNPGTRQDNFLVIPDRSETRTMEKIAFQSIFFSGRPFSMSMFSTFNHNFVNREYTSNVETFRTNFGGFLSYRNKIIPFSINYANENWDQKELQSGRKFLNKRSTIRANINKSFGKYDTHHFSYSFEDNSRKYEQLHLIKNRITTIDLKNNVNLNSNHSSNINSFIHYNINEGNERFDRIQVNENINVNLPYQAELFTTYRYSWFNQENLEYNQNVIMTRLEHQLFLSLHSSVFYEYTDFKQTAYDEYLNTIGFNINYQKKIPTGSIGLFYEYRSRNDNRNAQLVRLKIVDEQHELDDNKTILLTNPNVDINTVVITDQTHTIEYQENIDYLLIPRGIYTEVQRLPGGQINNGEDVYIQYELTKNSSHKFDIRNNTYGGRISLFSNLIELYFRDFQQDNKNIISLESQVLKNISQQVYGSRLTWANLSAGIEYDNFKSNIIPYQSKRYFINWSGSFNNKIRYLISGNRREQYLVEENEKQLFTDISGKFIYQILLNTKIKIDGGYRIQEGRGIDLTLNTLRGEILTLYRQIYLTLGLEMFKRDFSGSKINFTGGYLKLERRF